MKQMSDQIYAQRFNPSGWNAQSRSRQRARYAALAALLLSAAFAACQTPSIQQPVENLVAAPESIRLLAGDILKISFPGTPNLDTTQPIRRDGRIALQLVGEIQAAGMTPMELEKTLIDLYSSQLVSRKVSVTVVSSTFPIFVTGAVLRPGKIQSDRPLTALEAVMEAGGFDYAKANLKAITVIRHQDGEVKNFTLNLKLPLRGRPSTPFYLKPSDIVYVPEKFSWF